MAEGLTNIEEEDTIAQRQVSNVILDVIFN